MVSSKVSFSFTIFAFVVLFFAVVVAEIFGVLVESSFTGLLFTTLAGGVDTAGFIAFAALGLGSAFAGVTLAFTAATFGFGAVLAVCVLAFDGLAVDLAGFFLAVDTTATAKTLLFGLTAVFVFGTADEVADFAVGFDLEVSFLAIYLLDQNFAAT
jgi:hypothetical protein